MRRAALAVICGALIAATPAAGFADPVPSPPTDPIGGLRWLPADAEQQAISGRRLVFVYDHSVDPEGDPIPLLGRGKFAMTLATNTVGQLNVLHNSPSVEPARGRTDNEAAEFAFYFAQFFASAWVGDVRDGDCGTAGTPAFSAAYTTVRTFVHRSADPYRAVSAPGRCEVVLASERLDDGAYRTTVRTFVPGFWLDVHYTDHADFLPHGDELPSEIWYDAAYDEEGDAGPWYEAVDVIGSSVPVDEPKRYDEVFELNATPGAVGPNCPGSPAGFVTSAPGSWIDQPVDVPAGVESVTFSLFSTGHWNLRVIDPTGASADSRALISPKAITVPEAGGIEVLRSGRYILRACNYAGEPTVRATVSFI